MMQKLCFGLILLFLGLALSCGNEEKTLNLRPTLATLQHDVQHKFVGHAGIKELCEKYLGMRYLFRSEIEVEKLKQSSRADLTDPKIYKNDEDRFSQLLQDSFLNDVYVKFMRNYDFA